jgi:CHAT domain-containing protein
MSPRVRRAPRRPWHGTYASHVVGTLWPVSDSAARGVAIHVYRHLTHNGTTPPDMAATAVALHRATRRLRARYPQLSMLWAGHVHVGT